jgi:hypothetical protein
MTEESKVLAPPGPVDPSAFCKPGHASVFASPSMMSLDPGAARDLLLPEELFFRPAAVSVFEQSASLATSGDGSEDSCFTSSSRSVSVASSDSRESNKRPSQATSRLLRLVYGGKVCAITHTFLANWAHIASPASRGDCAEVSPCHLSTHFTKKLTPARPVYR